MQLEESNRPRWFSEAGVDLYHGDALAVLADMPENSVDAVIADPPYNVGKDYGPDHDDKLGPEEYEAWLRSHVAAWGRVSRDAVVFFPGTANMLLVPQVLRETGVAYRRMLGWHKREYAGDKWNGGPAMCWEPVVWASVAEKPYFTKIFGAWGRDFLTVNATHGDPFYGPHPCPKPLDVMKWLVGLFVPPGGVVLDPCCGSGTTLKAARDAGRRAIGVDPNESYLRLATDRLAQQSLEALRMTQGRLLWGESRLL